MFYDNRSPISCFFGFTLIEIILVIAMIGILCLISYPTYNKYFIKTRRIYATAMLLDTINRMENYHLKYNSYSGANLETLEIDNSLYNDHYKLEIKAKEDTYIIKAIPIGKQEQDSECGILSIDQDGNREISKNGNNPGCWR